MATAAKTCVEALHDATTHWPSRNRAWDGIMGDAAHQKRKSDHNDGNAYDLTHDPTHGVDCQVLSRLVINDARVTYVIWNRQIFNRARASEGWRAYTGPNPHNHHMHVSIEANSRDNVSPWPWSPGGGLGPVQLGLHPYLGKPLKPGDRGPSVLLLQQRLRDLKLPITADGIFGRHTEGAVINFQRQTHLTPDGLVGPKTWAALWKS